MSRIFGRSAITTTVALAAATTLLPGCNELDPGLAGGELGASQAAATAADGNACTPTGAHPAHGEFACATCHVCPGTVSFDPAGAAVVNGASPVFDDVAKTCSNVGCHAVPAGTFSYQKWDWGIEDLVTYTVPYGGTAGGGTADWYAAPGTSGCTVCHGYAPTYNGRRYAWHTGQHGINVANTNTCQACHPDARGAFVYGGPPSYVGTSGGMITSCPPGTYCTAPGVITNASLHRNGIVEVTPQWTSRCMNCH